MATLTLARNIPNGLTLMSSNEFDDVEQLEIASRSSTKLSLEMDNEQLNFIGRGFGYQMNGDQIVGITGGTVTKISITYGGQTMLNWSGLSVSAKTFFTYAATDNWGPLNTLLFKSSDTYKLTDRADRVAGFGGHDMMYGYNGNDTLYGDSGEDGLYGGAGNDKLYGGSSNDKLFGEAGNDRLSGGSGADTLWGGTGVDTLTGGSGADVFGFVTSKAADRDIITDFRAADDSLRFDHRAFTGMSYTGQLRASDFVLGTAALDGNDRFIYQKATGSLWFDADGSGSGVKVLVAELVDGTALSAADFFIF